MCKLPAFSHIPSFWYIVSNGAIMFIAAICFKILVEHKYEISIEIEGDKLTIS